MPYLTPSNPSEGIIKGGDPIQLPKIDLVTDEEYETLPNSLRKKYTYDINRRCYYVSDEEWAKNWRMHSPFYDDPANENYIDIAIGGSDVGTLFNSSELRNEFPDYPDTCHAYKSVLQLYHEKIGVEASLPEQKDNSFVLWQGHNLEEACAQMFLKEMQEDNPEDDIVLYNDTHMYRCGQKDEKGNLKYGFGLVNLDRCLRINGVEGILECKTCQYSSKDFATWKAGYVPLKYLLQGIYYMEVKNVSYMYFACIMGISESDIAICYLERDLELGKKVMEMVKAFVTSCRDNIEPDVTGEDYELVCKYLIRLNGVYDVKKAPIVELPTSFIKVVEKLEKMNAEEEFLNKQIDDVKAKKHELLAKYIIPAYGESTWGTIKDEDGNTKKVSIGSPYSRASLDEEKIKAEFPDLYKKACTKFDTTAFRNLFKKEIKDGRVIEDYYKPKTLSSTCSQVKIDNLE